MGSSTLIGYCKECAYEVHAYHEINIPSSDTSQSGTNIYECPNCGHPNHKDDDIIPCNDIQNTKSKIKS